jgi:hypothetical protein
MDGIAVVALMDANLSVGDGSLSVVAGKHYRLPSFYASEHARAGYVRLLVAPHIANVEYAIDPAAAAAEKRTRKGRTI